MKFENMNERICDLVSEYEYAYEHNYNPTTKGVDAILEEYERNKVNTPTFNGRSLLEGFERHPAYDGDGKIVLSEKMYRAVDRREINRFSDWVISKMETYNESIETKYKIGTEVTVISGSDIPEYFGDWVEDMDGYVGTNAKVTDIVKADGVIGYMLDGIDFVFDERGLDGESNVEVKEPIKLDYLKGNFSELPTFLGEEDTEAINRDFPWLKAHVGAKTSRVIGKICRHYGFDSDPQYNSRYTKFADAINPLAITRWTILSINPIDFLTMSFGNSWASCHTIDKTNLREMPNSYEGMYSAGTLSYMLDSTSFVMYTVDGSYNGKNYELQPKINRQMFHLGEDKLVQGRMYPQDNDTGAKELYDQFRAIAQRVIAECFGVDNYWTNKKGTGACSAAIRSKGVHYRDYEHFSNCNVSTLRGSENTNEMTVGHNPICITCGREFFGSDCIQCENCINEGAGHYCERCDDHIGDDAIHTYDDHWYCCPDCAQEEGYVLCNDDEWHREDRGDVMYDDYLGEYMYDDGGYWDDRVETRDGRTYTCPDNAIADGWEYCSNCSEWVRSEYYDYGLDMCSDCALEHEREEVTA